MARAAEAEVAAYAAVTRALGAGTSFTDVASSLLDAIADAFRLDRAAAWETRGGTLVLVARRGVAGPEAEAADLAIATEALRQGAPIFGGGQKHDSASARYLAIPIASPLRDYGVLVAYPPGPAKRAVSATFLSALSAQIVQFCEASWARQTETGRAATYREVLLAIPDVVFRMGEDGTLIGDPALSAVMDQKVSTHVLSMLAHSTLPRAKRALLTRRRKSGIARIASLGQVRDYETRILPVKDDEVLVLARDVTDQTRTEEELQLFLGITLTTAETADLRTALRAVLRLVCESTGWCVGQAWVPDAREVLHCTASWLTGLSPSHETFRDASERVAFESGDGLPGRVHAAARPAWIRDVTEHPEFVRIDAARRAGLKSGFAVPVLADTEVVAVLEFYAVVPRDEDERLLTMVSAVAEQLGAILIRKRGEEELRLLETALAQISESILITTAEGDGRPAQIVYVSPAFSRMTQYRPDEVVGRSLSILEGAETGDALTAHLARALRDGGHFELESIHYRKDGSPVPLEWRVAPLKDTAGGVTHFIAVQRDITQRKLADRGREQLQRALETAARQWRLTFDAIESPILMLDKEGRVLRMNRAARLLSGAEYKEQLGRGLEAFGDIEPWSRGIDVVAAVLGARGPISSQVKDEARGKTWDFSATLLDETDDEKVILVVRDITRLVELKDSLRRSETMSAMGSLVAGVAHEVRNPLHAITVTLDAFEARFRIGAEHRAHIGVLRGEVARLSALMRDLLEYGKPAAPTSFVGALSDVIRQAASECAAQADAAGVTVTCDVPLSLPTLRMDPSRLLQVFQNILENAIQHCTRGGQVRVTAKLLPESGEGEPRLECAIEDDGRGFREADLGRAFEPFFTRRHGGTGLGLSIVYRIVDEHGGTVSASNRPEGGAMILVRLPLRGAPGSDAPSDLRA